MIGGATMATYEIISWRGVPAVVEARDEQGAVTRSLSDRFQILIDAAAMQLGLAGSEEYLEQWSRRAPPGRSRRAPPRTRCADPPSSADS